MPKPAPGNKPLRQPVTAPNSAMETRFAQQSWLLSLVLVLITFLAYQPVIHNGFVWDDDSYVTENQALRSADGLARIWIEPGATPQYYPLVFTTFWGEYHLWKLRPLGYHLVNVLLHALNVVLIWRVLRWLQIPGAWLAAAIFAVHPVTVESVAWVTERKNVLSTLFYLLALLAYLRFQPGIIGGQSATLKWRYYPLVLLLFLCALWSKTVTCSLPAVLALLLWWKKGRVDKRDVLTLAPLFALGAALGLVTVWMEKHYVGASGPEWGLSLVQRFLIAGRALWFYLEKVIWPVDLVFIYPRWNVDGRVAWQYLFPLGALALVVILWSLRTRFGKGPLVAVLYFVGTLVPALGFIDVYPFRYSYVADHFQYLACVAPIALMVSGGVAVFKRIGQWRYYCEALVAGVLLLALGMCTWRQTHAYHDSVTLWQDTVTKEPDVWLAHNNLGAILRQSGRSEEAIGHFEEALRIKPDFAEAHYNLGVTLARLNRFPEAIRHYEQALRLTPDFAQAHYNLGLALAESGRVPEAMKHLEQAVQLKPDYAEAYFNLGLMLDSQGRTREASEDYRKALDLANQKGNTTLADAIRSRIEVVHGTPRPL
jgi:protein O-mannosyl-transferase